MSRFTCALLATLAGCVDASPPTTLEPDVDGYVQFVHDYVEVGCGTLDCHGDEGRPLRLYGEFGLRDADRGEELTPAELEANALSLVSVDSAPPAMHLVLLKPLSESAGGLEHVGGTVWEDAEAPGYQCLRSWLEGDIDQPACERAASLVFVP